MTKIFRHQRLLIILSIFLGLLSAATSAQKYEISTADKNIGSLVEVGKYIVEARRNGNNWYLAAINDWTPQTLLNLCMLLFPRLNSCD